MSLKENKALREIFDLVAVSRKTIFGVTTGYRPLSTESVDKLSTLIAEAQKDEGVLENTTVRQSLILAAETLNKYKEEPALVSVQKTYWESLPYVDGEQSYHRTLTTDEVFWSAACESYTVQKENPKRPEILKSLQKSLYSKLEPAFK
jgi:hypothetical protein